MMRPAGALAGVVLIGASGILHACVRPRTSTPDVGISALALDTAIVRGVLQSMLSRGWAVRVDPRPLADIGEFSTPAGSGFSPISASHLDLRKAIIASLGLPLTDAARDEQCPGILMPRAVTPPRLPACPESIARSVAIALPRLTSPTSAFAVVVTHELSSNGRSTSGWKYVFAKENRRWKFLADSVLFWIE